MSIAPPAVYTELDSPIGRLTLTGNGRALTGVHLAERPTAGGRRDDGDDEALREARRQFAEYFAGERRVFDLPLEALGTAFQRGVWQALRDIPHAETISYGELARRIGNPQARRAVGLANGRNPLPIVVPCHRVIGTNGRLVGFRGGLERKRWLLAHEQAHAPAAKEFNGNERYVLT